MDVPLGRTVSVELTALPRSAAAEKTLLRLFAKDPLAQRRHRWQSRHRPSWQTWRRGGNQWHHQMRTKPTVPLATGNRVSLLATVDVVRDLHSVQRWVKVTAG
jgi:hypothetical protein